MPPVLHTHSRAHMDQVPWPSLSQGSKTCTYLVYVWHGIYLIAMVILSQWSRPPAFQMSNAKPVLRPSIQISFHRLGPFVRKGLKNSFLRNETNTFSKCLLQPRVVNRPVCWEFISSGHPSNCGSQTKHVTYNFLFCGYGRGKLVCLTQRCTSTYNNLKTVTIYSCRHQRPVHSVGRQGNR